MKNVFKQPSLAAILGVVLLQLSLSVTAQAQRPTVGDLVELVTGLGPTLGEITAPMDASGYVMLRLPTGKTLPVMASKLRLVQGAGTPNADIAVGTAASWTSQGVREAGNVTKVNGNWCLVSADSATTIGWLECKSLRVAGQAAPPKPAATAKTPAAKLAPAKLLGKWENADGSAKLEFQAANKCFLSLGPLTSPCTYEATGTGVKIEFDGEEMLLAANADGSLSSGADSMLPMRFTHK